MTILSAGKDEITQNCFGHWELLLSYSSLWIKTRNEERKNVSTKGTYLFECNLFQPIIREKKEIFNDFIPGRLVIVQSFNEHVPFYSTLLHFLCVCTFSRIVPSLPVKREKERVFAFRHVQYNQLDRQPVLLEKFISCLHSKALHSAPINYVSFYLTDLFHFCELLLRVSNVTNYSHKIYTICYIKFFLWLNLAFYF
jgi:hypothetical protein